MSKACEAKTVEVTREDIVDTNSGALYTITHVELTLNRTVKVAEYQYIKPSVSIRAQVHSPKMLDVITEELYDVAACELDKVVSKEVATCMGD